MAGPVLERGPEGSWDDSSPGGHAVLDSAGIVYKMWYGASDDPNRIGNIGYAESDTRIPVLTLIGEPLLDTSMVLEAVSTRDGSILMAFPGPEMPADSVVKYAVASVHAVANVPTRIPLTAVQPGSYMVTAISDSGCICYRGVTIRIVDDLKPPDVLLEKKSIHYGESIIASSSKDGVLFLVENGTPANMYYIRNSRFLIDSAVVKSNIPVAFSSSGLQAEEYRLYALDKYGFLSKPEQLAVFPSGISRPASSENWMIFYPNPFDNQLMIRLPKQGNYALSIYSLSGQVVRGFEWKGGSNEIDLSSLDPGQYIIKINSGDRSWSGKLMKLP
jgi:hypothetical protein